jgi:glycerate kinase
MNILIAPDSFKGSLTAPEAADAIGQGVLAVLPGAEIVSLPLGDGGEGTAEALVRATRGRLLTRSVTGPLGEPVEASFGLLGDDVTAVVETAAASGLSLVPAEKRNPLLTTSYGTGELIRAALDEGCTRLLVGLGGSATNDGGAGLAQALGARLLTAEGKEIRRGGAALAQLERIDISGLDPRVGKVRVLAACDVKNPLSGPEGASAVYGPQKGANPEMVEQLDLALGHYAEVIRRDLGQEVADYPGAGAAGGIGAGLVAFLKAELHSGIALVLDLLGFEEYLESADLVLTGEGRIDPQTGFGKAVFGVGAVAMRRRVPVIAFTGAVAEEPENLAGYGVEATVPIVSGPMSETEAMGRGAELLQKAVESTLRLLLLGGKLTDWAPAPREQP